MKKTWLTIKETLHSIPPLHLYLYYLCFVVTVYRCYNPVIVQHTIALCPLSTPKQWCSGAYGSGESRGGGGPGAWAPPPRNA